MHAIFFTPKGLAMQASIPKGKSMNARFYREKVLLKMSNSTRTVDLRAASAVFICYMTMPQSKGRKCDVVLMIKGSPCSRTFTLFP